MGKKTRVAMLASLCAGLGGSPGLAATVPYTEPFASNSAGWADAVRAPLSWSPAGGVEDSGYAHGAFHFGTSAAGADLAMIRGGLSLGSSGGAFFGNWVEDGVDKFSAYVRHDADLPLTFFVRFAGTFNFPGAIIFHPEPVSPQQWTLMSFSIDPANADFIYEGPGFQGVFGDIGNIQIGIHVPPELAGTDRNIVFGVDQISIVPEPSCALLLAAGALWCLRRAQRGARG